MTAPLELVLASASPRRARILRGMGVAFRVMVPEVDEVMYADDSQRTAGENCGHKLAWCRDQDVQQAIIAADTVVEHAGQCLTKPADQEEAFAMLSRLSGQSHTVYTGVAMWRPGTPAFTRVESTTVHFKSLDRGTIEEYFRRVNPLDKAGGYDAGQCGDMIIDHHEGSWTNVIGLPRRLVADWLRDAGIPQK